MSLLRLLVLFSLALPSCMFRKQIDNNKMEILNVDDYPYDHYKTSLKNLLERPRILLGATEFGPPMSFADGTSSHALHLGGLGTVMHDLIEEIPKFQQRYANAHKQVSFAFMASDGLVYGEKVTTFVIPMGDKTTEVEVYKNKHKNGSDIYFLKNEAFTRRSTVKVYRHRVIKPLTPYPDLELAYDYILFSKALAQLYTFTSSNILHVHDYHTALAATYLHRLHPVILSIHNGGAFYRGELYTDNHYDKLDYLLYLAGISPDEYDDYFRLAGSDFALLGASRLIARFNLIGGIAVSPQYAKELTWTKDDLLAKIGQEKNGIGPLREERLFLFNGGMRFPYLAGAYNGLGLHNHASQNPFLKKNPADASWPEDLSFGDDDAAELKAKKAKLKQLVQKTYGLPADPNAPLFTVVSRLAHQKGVDIFVRNVERLVKKYNAQVAIVGPGKIDGVNVEMENLVRKYKNVYFRASPVTGREKAVLQAGADFTVITSLFEPCGLTDVEAAWLGTVVIGRRVGGIGKVAGGLYYDWHDSSDREGEAAILWRTLENAMQEYFERPAVLNERRLQGLRARFDWQDTLQQYDRHYVNAALFKLMLRLQAQDLPNEELARRIADIKNMLPGNAYGSYFKHQLSEKIAFEKRAPGPVESLFLNAL